MLTGSVVGGAIGDVTGICGAVGGWDGGGEVSLKYSDICRRRVEFLGPLSCWTASLFIPTLTHLLRRQARHWFLCVLSTMQSPSDLALQTYCLLRRIDLCRKTTKNKGLENQGIQISWESRFGLCFFD